MIINVNLFENFDIILFPLLVGILLSFTAAIIGVVLVLKRYSMIGDGLSHVSFGVFAVLIALSPMIQDSTIITYIAIPIVMVVAYLLLRIGESTKIKGDAAIGLISSVALAIGYFVGSLSEGFTKDINSMMFGSVVTANKQDFFIILPVTLVVILVFIILYNRIFAVTFDEDFAKATGMRTKTYNMIFAFFTAITVVIGIKIMGALLISSLILLPALSAMQVFTKFKKVIIASSIISVFCFVFAFFVFAKYSSASSIVIVNFVVFIVFSIIGFFRRKFARA